MDVLEHGTVQGYRDGCRGRGECVPSFLGTCSDAMVRYRGDYSFSRAVDAGATLAELEARDVAAREADVARVREQNAAARAEGAKRRELVAEPKVARVPSAPKSKRAPAVRAPKLVATPKPRVERGPTKAEIRADERGRREQAAADARAARGRLHAARGALEAAEGALVNARIEVAAAAEQYEVAAAALSVLDSRAAAREEREREKADRAAERERVRGERESRRSSDAEERRDRRRRGQQTHGTAGGYQQGCRVDEKCPQAALGLTTCHQAYRAYHRDYAARRKARAAADPSLVTNHGTESGYVQGCRDNCPSSPTCREAMNVADRARRRRQGVQPRPDTQHGTRAGYRTLKCRDGCPASPTCREVAVAYAAEQNAKRAPRGPRALPEHGTTAMYSRGCHKGAPCPAMPSCYDVHAAYQRDYAARRKAVGS